MRKVLFLFLLLGSATLGFAQDSAARRSMKPRVDVTGGDHLLVQFGYTWWQGKPDSLNTGGFSRTFNAYLMFSFPFKTNPHLSVALGPGIATDHIFFEKTRVNIAEPTSTLVFENRSDTDYFKKYKLATAYLELPVELRYSSKPFDNKHSIKVALGAKIATILSAWTKGDELSNKNGSTIKDYTMKEKSTRFFNTTRLSVMGRIGYGPFSLFTSYAITPLLKEGAGPELRPMTIGLTLSGL